MILFIGIIINFYHEKLVIYFALYNFFHFSAGDDSYRLRGHLIIEHTVFIAHNIKSLKDKT